LLIVASSGSARIIRRSHRRIGHTRLRAWLAWSLLAGWLLATSMVSPAFAQASSGDKAAAETLFNQAIELMGTGDYATACPKLEESQKLDPAVGTLLYLGECYEQRLMVASAWAAFNAAAQAARVSKQAAREKTAKERAAALEPRLPKLVIVVPDPTRVAGLEVKRDGFVVGEASFGVPVPLDGGEHEVSAAAPGRKSWSQKVKVIASGGTRTIEIPALALDAGAADALPGPAPAAGGEPADGGLGTGNGQRIAGGVIGGVGLAGIVVGIVYGVQASAKESDSEAFCEPPDYTLCTEDGLTLLDEAATSSLISNVSFVVGGVLVAGGIVVILTAPSDPDAASEPSGAPLPAQARWTLSPLAAPGLGGLLLRADW
jgi:hypothetical protein